MKPEAPSAPYLILGFYRESTPAVDLTAAVLRQANCVPSAGFAYRRQNADQLNVVFNGDHGRRYEEAFSWLESIQASNFSEFELSITTLTGRSKTELLGNWKTLAPYGPSPVVSLCMGGSAFMEVTPGAPDREGIAAYDRFIALCSNLNPTYAAITVEWELDSPIELINNSRSYEGFRDFYLGKELGEVVLSAVTSVFKDAFIRKVGDGVYVSSGRWFNPDGIHLEDREARSCQTGAILAKHFKAYL